MCKHPSKHDGHHECLVFLTATNAYILRCAMTHQSMMGITSASSFDSHISDPLYLMSASSLAHVSNPLYLTAAMQMHISSRCRWVGCSMTHQSMMGFCRPVLVMHMFSSLSRPPCTRMRPYVYLLARHAYIFIPFVPPCTRIRPYACLRARPRRFFYVLGVIGFIFIPLVPP